MQAAARKQSRKTLKSEEGKPWTNEWRSKNDDDTPSQEDSHCQQLIEAQLDTWPELQTMWGRARNTKSPMQRLPLLEASLGLKQWLNLSVLNTVGMNGSLHNYWRKYCSKFQRRQRKNIDGIMIYFWWNVWKEWNRRTFQQKSQQPLQVALLCKEDIQQYQLATRPIVNAE